MASGVGRLREWTAPEPLELEATQRLLAVDEALVVTLELSRYESLPEATMIWVVTRESAQWRLVSKDEFDVRQNVHALRCGLDATLWHELASREDCSNLTGTASGTLDVSNLPFDHVRAYALYAALLAPFEASIAGKHLIVVPDGILSTLPFSVLLTARPETAVPLQWLGLRQAISVLPSVTALANLRQRATTSRATRAYLGIANPLLDGPDQSYAGMAEAARRRSRCASPADPVAALPGFARHAPHQTIARIFGRDARFADVVAVRKAAPLPETADEVCEVANWIDPKSAEVLLGERASETALKAMSTSGNLANYRVLHFATHGVLSGQIDGTAEPGLILSPPLGTGGSGANEHDDAFLSASEIAALNLDADWVVLSACNTAASDTGSGEALSGLVRAFLYAGARSMLVSHWEVESNATVRLATGVFRELAAIDPPGRAEALRRSMQALAGGATAREMHPAVWAPFILVGDGGSQPNAAAPGPASNAAPRVEPEAREVPPLPGRPKAMKEKVGRADKSNGENWNLHPLGH